MKRRTLLLFFIGSFVLGISIAFGISSTVTFIVDRASPETVVLDPSIAFQNIYGGPAPELDDTETEVLPEQEDQKYVLRGKGTFPRTYARSLIVADIDTGEVIAAKNAYQSYPIASLTKLMTAVVAEELYNTRDETTISKTAIQTYGEQGRLREGEVYTIEELFYPLLLESSNDAAEALAEYGGRIKFMASMNEKAQDLSLVHTRFNDPSGLSERNISAAYDLFLLSQYIDEFRRYIFDITELNRYTSSGVTWYNNSRFKNDSFHVGSKNGYTDEALKTQIVLVDLPLEGENGIRTIGIILLGSSNTEADARAIIKFLNRHVYYE